MTTTTMASDALKALEPATRDANAFKARAALIAMREIIDGTTEATEAGVGARACWSGCREWLGSGKKDARKDAVKTTLALMRCGITREEMEDKLSFAWKHANWRFRVSAIEILSATMATTEDDAFARRCFDAFARTLGDREGEVREQAMDGIAVVFEKFPRVGREALEATKDAMRPQHVKEIERRLDGAKAETNEMETSKSASESMSASAVVKPLGDGLVPPPPERISNEREFTRAMDRVTRDLRPDVDWLKRIAAMVRLEAITLGGGGEVYEDAFTSSLGRAVEVLLAQISDRRSAVVKQVSHLLVTLARGATKSFAQYVDHFVMALLKTTVVTVGVIADSGNACIRGIIEHCHAPKLVQRLTDAVVAERAPKMRGCIVEYLSIILKTWELSNRHIDAIGDALRVTLSDADATVRANSKACFEILSVTSPTASGDLLTRVDSKLARSLSNLTNDSESEETSSVGRRGRSGSLSSAPSRIAPEAPAAKKPPTPAPTEARDIASAVMFAERVERAAERASRAEASSRLRGALDDADARTHGARAAQFEAEVTLHAARIAELLLGYISDSNALVLDPALESIATLVYIASEDLKQVMPDLCLGVFECLTDHRESTRSLSSEALTAIGDVHKPNALLPALLRSLHLASTAKTKTGVLEFALYVLSGRGGGADEVVHTPASVSANLESWIDLVVELACDVNEPLAKAAGSNLGAIHAHVDGAVVPRRLLASSEYKRVRFMEAVERRVPKLAEMLRPFLEAPPPPPPAPPPAPAPSPPVVTATMHDVGYDSLDEEHGYEDQNMGSLNRSYETMRIEASAGKSRHAGVGERIVEAMEGLRDENIDTVVRSLRTIASSAEDCFAHFKPYMPLLVPTVCSAMDDENELVAAHAYGALRAIFQHREIDTEDAFTALAPLINAYSASTAPLICAHMIIETADAASVESSLPLVLPSVADACASKTVAIRHRALNALGACQRTFGAASLSPYVEALSVTHRAVLAHYARN